VSAPADLIAGIEHPRIADAIRPRAIRLERRLMDMTVSTKSG